MKFYNKYISNLYNLNLEIKYIIIIFNKYKMKFRN